MHHTLKLVFKALGRAAQRAHQPARVRSGRNDRGASTIETVIIAASLAALALATMATITLLVNGKVGGIHL